MGWEKEELSAARSIALWSNIVGPVKAKQVLWLIKMAKIKAGFPVHI